MLSTPKADSIAGAGLGLRFEHYQEILTNTPAVPWFEVLVENYMGRGGLPHHYLKQICNNYPITFHGVGMSLGSTDPLNTDYLQRLKALIDQYQPVLVSDHLAWVSVNNTYMHDLLPLPYTEESLTHVASRVLQVQELLGRPLVIENPSSYLGYTNGELSEVAFIGELVKKSGCELLLDVNNVYVSAINHGFDAYQYIDAFPLQQVREIHLAGFEERDSYLYDTHGYSVRDSVWSLYQYVIEKTGPIPTLIEWDNDIPPLTTLLDEAGKAQFILDRNTLSRKIA